MCVTKPVCRGKSLSNSSIDRTAELNVLPLTTLSHPGHLEGELLTNANEKGNIFSSSHDRPPPPTPVLVGSTSGKNIFYRTLSSEYVYRKPVEHDYHDHADDDEECESNSQYSSGDGCNVHRMKAKGGVVTPFPLKLHALLDEIENDGHSDIVSWQPHGRCFVVHKPKAFIEHVMPAYFKLTKIASFQRQLNLYGFNRLTTGADKGGYYHELFLRGKAFLCLRIHRQKVKGTRIRAPCNPDTEPNFYAMPPVNPTTTPQSVKFSDEKKRSYFQSTRPRLFFTLPPNRNNAPRMTQGMVTKETKSMTKEMITVTAPVSPVISAEKTQATIPSIAKPIQVQSESQVMMVAPPSPPPRGSVPMATTQSSSCCISFPASAAIVTPTDQPKKKPCLARHLREYSDDVLIFEGKPFHCLDVYRECSIPTIYPPTASVSQTTDSPADISPKSSSSMERDVYTTGIAPSLVKNSFELTYELEEAENGTNDSALTSPSRLSPSTEDTFSEN